MNSNVVPIKRVVGPLAIGILIMMPAGAQVVSANALSSQGTQQLNAVNAAKASFTAAETKLDSALVFGLRVAAGDPSTVSFRTAIPAINKDAAGRTLVAIHGTVTSALTQAVNALGGVVVYESLRWGVVTAALPPASLLKLAARSDVRTISLPPRAKNNVGSLTSQAYISHSANKVVNDLKFNGSGVTVGVLSDSASATRIATLIASGDLPAGTHSLPGQAGAAHDEGTAMMEIVHDMAPGANLLFATAFESPESFAANIIALQQAGCSVIVDDVSWSNEGVFQDSVIAQAVNQVVANGAVYLSSAANSGNLTLNTSGTWEGDFVSAATVGTPGNPPVQIHNFGTVPAPQGYNAITFTPGYVDLKWSDPLGASTNDYDLFIFDGAGTTLKGFSNNRQDGTGDPEEAIFPGTNCGKPEATGYCSEVGDKIVVVLHSGAPRALHLVASGGQLSIPTTGATSGHNAGAATISVAATFWNSAKIGTFPFTGFANVNEVFSSDGPRKIFYSPEGNPITPDNFLFSTKGGKTLIKPDIAAADGVSTATPGFLPFFGTSAASPHAAGIAALILSARPGLTPRQVWTAMVLTANDSMEQGVDRDSGFGVVSANSAVLYALTH